MLLSPKACSISAHILPINIGSGRYSGHVYAEAPSVSVVRPLYVFRPEVLTRELEARDTVGATQPAVLDRLGWGDEPY